MPRQYEISAIILDRESRGETGVMLTALSPERGLVYLFKRISAKKTSLVPDIFCEISAQTQVPQTAENGLVHFVKDFSSVKSRDKISLSYEKLCDASEIASVVKLNGANIDETSLLFDLLGKALDGVAEFENTAAVKIKFLYVLAKEQGYAVKEDFFSRLSQTDKAAFAKILKTPVAELSADAATQRLYEALRRWTAENTDIVF